MTSIALKMLFGERAKMIGMVLGVAFCTLLISQQLGLFVGLMLRAQNVIAEMSDVDIWVMDPATEYVDLARPMRDISLHQVRGAAGVAWAAPLFKAATSIKTADGRIRSAVVLGLDDASLTGITKRFLIGTADDLRRPDAIAIDRAGYRKLWPGEPLRVGRILELNDRRTIVAAITDAKPAFAAQVIIHTRFTHARRLLGAGRKQLTFVLARAAAGADPDQVARAITQRTGLKSLTAEEFSSATVNYYLRKTGIPINFATTVILGLIVGAVIVGLTFHAFVTDNLRQFATLKIIGVTHLALARIVVVQVLTAALIGYALGTGLAASFFEFACGPTSALRGMYLPWWVATGTAVVVVAVVLTSTVLSLRRVLVSDPAVVLRS